MPEKESVFRIRFDTRTIVLMGLLTAIEVVLSRFLSFSVWNMKIGLSFLPIVAAAILLGPLHAGIVGALADFVGAILFPIAAYFPGFTLTAFLMGFVFGLFLRQKQTFLRILGAVAVNQLLLSLLLNSYWISLFYGAPYAGLLPARALQTLILVPLQLIVILALSKALRHLPKPAAAEAGADHGDQTPAA